MLPLSFNLSDTMNADYVQIDGSWWANSFIHGSNGHNYYIASHVMDYGSEYDGALPIYRASIMDVTDPSFYRNFIRNGDGNTTYYPENADFSAKFDGYGMESNHESVHTWCSLEGIDFDLTFNFTSPVILNAALGSYFVGGRTGWEWSLPRGYTQGWFKVNDEVIEVDPELSSTWLDRQWGSVQDSFQWFAINLEESDWLDISILSVWDWKDAANGGREFATIRSSKTGRDSVVHLDVQESSTVNYISPETGLVYPQEWTITLDDLEILVTSPREEQLIEAPETGFPTQFSGYLEVVAKKPGHSPVKGYAATDFLQPFP